MIVEEEYGTLSMHFHFELLHCTSSLPLSHCIKDPEKL